MKIKLPDEVNNIIAQLESHGYEAYIVGGCVRDALLGRNPEDWDITSNALPEDIKRIFPVTIDTGIAHGTVTVRRNKKNYEVTTYRVDGEYIDSRHPENVTFVRNLKEDLRRRDFTVNAMAYNDRVGLVDEFSGFADLKSGIIRCVEDPYRRFSEDALRMLRAVRFLAQLDFSLENKTREAISSLAGNLSKISAERICSEFIKIITGNHPEAILEIYNLHLTKSFFPEWDEMMITPQNTVHHKTDVGNHSLLVMQNVKNTKKMRLAALLHDVGKPICRKVDAKGSDHFAGHPQVGAQIAKDVLERLKLDNDTIRYVTRIVKFHDDRPPVTKRTVRRLINRIGEDLFPDMLDFRLGDILGQSEYRRDEKVAEIDKFREYYNEIMKNNYCVSIKSLAIAGSDIIDLGQNPGPRIGEILSQALDYVIDDPQRNNRETLIAFARERILV